MNETVIVNPEKLHKLIKNKLVTAGLKTEHAEEVAKHLVFADACGIHSHGAVRVEYYAEQIDKGGVTLDPNIEFGATGPSTGILHGKNGAGQYVANVGLGHAIDMAKKSGVAVVGISKISHSGALSYYVKKAAMHDLIAIAMCQSDPMVVPFGGKENYFGTNPIAFAAPRKSSEPVVFDMATTVQAWGKVLDARSKNMDIPNTWAVDREGKATTDPYKVNGLLPIAGPKGYGLMMMVDILSGILLGLPFGKHVSSMYDDITKGRNVGQMYVLIDPSRFTDLEIFKTSIDTMVEELHEISPADGFKQVYYPGEVNQLNYEQAMSSGVEIVKDIYDYLKSNTLHYDRYEHTNAFGERK